MAEGPGDGAGDAEPARRRTKDSGRQACSCSGGAAGRRAAPGRRRRGRRSLWVGGVDIESAARAPASTASARRTGGRSSCRRRTGPPLTHGWHLQSLPRGARTAWSPLKIQLRSRTWSRPRASRGYSMPPWLTCGHRRATRWGCRPAARRAGAHARGHAELRAPGGGRGDDARAVGTCARAGGGEQWRRLRAGGRTRRGSRGRASPRGAGLVTRTMQQANTRTQGKQSLPGHRRGEGSSSNGRLPGQGAAGAGALAGGRRARARGQTLAGVRTRGLARMPALQPIQPRGVRGARRRHRAGHRRGARLARDSATTHLRACYKR